MTYILTITHRDGSIDTTSAYDRESLWGSYIEALQRGDQATLTVVW